MTGPPQLSDDDVKSVQILWQMLTLKALDGSAPLPGSELVSGTGRVFYSDVGRRLEHDPYREVPWLCDVISDVCLVRGLPHLNALVVAKSDYLPGDGIPLDRSRQGESRQDTKVRLMREVWAYPWPQDFVPDAEEIRRAWSLPDDARRALAELHAAEVPAEEMVVKLAELGCSFEPAQLRPPTGAPYPPPEPSSAPTIEALPEQPDPAAQADLEQDVTRFREEISDLGDRQPRRVESVSERIERDPRIVDLLRSRNIQRCELCDRPWGLFKKKDGTRFTEVHHIHPLADGGPDVLFNCIELCATCHRWFHHGDCTVEDLGDRWRIAGERVLLGRKQASIELWKDPLARVEPPDGTAEPTAAT